MKMIDKQRRLMVACVKMGSLDVLSQHKSWSQALCIHCLQYENCTQLFVNFILQVMTVCEHNRLT